MITLGTAQARAELLEDEAPATCDLVWRVLPADGKTGHSVESGKEVFMLLDREIEIAPENQTIYEIPGDVEIYHKQFVPPPIEPQKLVISFVYDRDTQIRALHGPVAVNLFAHITDGLSELEKEAIRMRRVGFERMKVSRA